MDREQSRAAAIGNFDAADIVGFIKICRSGCEAQRFGRSEVRYVMPRIEYDPRDNILVPVAYSVLPSASAFTEKQRPNLQPVFIMRSTIIRPTAKGWDVDPKNPLPPGSACCRRDRGKSLNQWADEVLERAASR